MQPFNACVHHGRLLGADAQPQRCTFFAKAEGSASAPRKAVFASSFSLPRTNGPAASLNPRQRRLSKLDCQVVRPPCEGDRLWSLIARGEAVQTKHEFPAAADEIKNTITTFAAKSRSFRLTPSHPGNWRQWPTARKGVLSEMPRELPTSPEVPE